MFTSHSGKTNHSAPVPGNETNENSSADNEGMGGQSPTNIAKMKDHQ